MAYLFKKLKIDKKVATNYPLLVKIDNTKKCKEMINIGVNNTQKITGEWLMEACMRCCIHL